MKWLLSILLFLPICTFPQDIQSIEICNSNQSYLQEYWVDGSLGLYKWTVTGGSIVSGQGTNQIVVNWLNVLSDQYILTVSIISDDGCVGDTASLIIDINECSFVGIYIPNSFTPNEIQPNNIFNPVGENIIESDLVIFDRWGQEIFKSHNGNGWDGTLNGEMCQIDVYIWLISYRFKGEDFMHHSIGHVTLIR